MLAVWLQGVGEEGWGGRGGGVRPHLPTSLRQCGERKEKEKGTGKYVVCCFIALWRGCGIERCIGITLFCSFIVGARGLLFIEHGSSSCSLG